MGIVAQSPFPPPRWRVTVAVDYTPASRDGVRQAAALTRALGGQLTAVTVESAPPGGRHRVQQEDLDKETDRLRRWISSETGGLEAEVAVRIGLPGVELSRFAEEVPTDLLVLVRKHRSQLSRVIHGDTVDSVVRRSVVPCLLLLPGAADLAGLVVALDGSSRGLMVFDVGYNLARALHKPARGITVEPEFENEPEELAARVPTTRTRRLEEAIRARQPAGNGKARLPLSLRRGEAVGEILAEMEDYPDHALVLGYHRGGPPGVIEAGSVARQLVHRAPCPVVTVPL